jgi:hypothetical protein
MLGFVEVTTRRLSYLRNVGPRDEHAHCSHDCRTPPAGCDQAEVRS